MHNKWTVALLEVSEISLANITTIEGSSFRGYIPEEVLHDLKKHCALTSTRLNWTWCGFRVHYHLLAKDHLLTMNRTPNISPLMRSWLRFSVSRSKYHFRNDLFSELMCSTIGLKLKLTPSPLIDYCDYYQSLNMSRSVNVMDVTGLFGYKKIETVRP